MARFIVPNGSIKSNKQFTVELYGGQGCIVGINNSSVGRGGYTKLISQLGNKFNEGSELYIFVGANGSRGNGGFNGGAKADWGGGGATHLATKDGQLSSLSGSKSSVIAVAGGGGGFNRVVDGSIGQGGGANQKGMDGTAAFGGTLNSGGCNYDNENCGSFGNGGICNKEGSGGGGAGYYGGAGCYKGISNYPGGGGSGYCNESYGSCSGSTGTRSGNGYAKITW